MTRRAWVVVDLGFGDAGKGSVVDFLVRDRGAGLVVRFNGGAQAGHTVLTPDRRKHSFAQLGAGTFVPGVRTHLGPGFVLHPGGLALEVERLEGLGVDDALDRTTVDERVVVISPFQQAAGRLRELLRGESAHGTCGVGVGEAVADALAGLEDGIVVADLAHPDRLRRKLASQQRRKRAELSAARRLVEPRAWNEVGLLDDAEAVDRCLDLWRPLAARLNPVDAHTGRRVLAEAETVVFEGAQGVLLDERWGFHPHTTWSDCTPAGALALVNGLGAEVTRLGVHRCYAVRHGPGPFVSHDLRFDQVLDEPDNHDLGWQGRFRRGPLDLVMLRYATAVCGGLDGLALTHLDRFQEEGRIPVCAAYALDGQVDAVRRDEHGQVLALDPGAPEDLAHREALTRVLSWCEPLHASVPLQALPALLERELKLPVLLESRGRTAEDKRWLRPVA